LIKENANYILNKAQIAIMTTPKQMMAEL